MIPMSDLDLADSVLIDYIGGLTRFQMECEGQHCTLMIPDFAAPIFSGVDLEYTVERFHEDRHATSAQWNATINSVPIGVQSGGISVTQFDQEALFTFDSYGGWMEHGIFATDFLQLDGSRIWGYAFTLGVSDPDNNSPPDVDVIWEGAMLGRFSEATTTTWAEAAHRVRGEVIAIYRAEDKTMGVVLTNVVDIDAEAPHAAHPSMYWEGLEVSNGHFIAGSDGDSIQGQFYGADHQEIGGIFERDSIVGSFGVRRH